MTQQPTATPDHYKQVRAYLKFLATFRVNIYYSQLAELVLGGSSIEQLEALNDLLHKCAEQDSKENKPLVSCLVIYKRRAREEIEFNAAKTAPPAKILLVAGVGVTKYLGKIADYPELKGKTADSFGMVKGKEKDDLIRTFNLCFIKEQERVYKHYGKHDAITLLRRYGGWVEESELSTQPLPNLQYL